VAIPFFRIRLNTEIQLFGLKIDFTTTKNAGLFGVEQKFTDCPPIFDPDYIRETIHFCFSGILLKWIYQIQDTGAQNLFQLIKDLIETLGRP